MKTIRVIIRPEHFVRASCFFGGDCPLIVALKDMEYHVRSIGTEFVRLKGKIGDEVRFAIPKEQWGGYTSPYPPGHIDRLCAKAKRDISSIPTVVLDLKSY